MNYGDQRIDKLIRLVEKRDRPFRLVAGLILNQAGEVTLSGSNTITLTNAATPSEATRYLGILDLANGTAIPSIVSSNPALLAIVVGSVTGTQVTYGAYPIDTSPETADIVTVTITENTESLVQTFSIFGTTTAAESFTLDDGSLVGAWVGAPTLPSVPT